MKYEKAVRRLVGPPPKLLRKGNRAEYVTRRVAEWDHPSDIEVTNDSVRRQRAQASIDLVTTAGDSGDLDAFMVGWNNDSIEITAHKLFQPSPAEHPDLLQSWYIKELLERLRAECRTGGMFNPDPYQQDVSGTFTGEAQ